MDQERRRLSALDWGLAYMSSKGWREHHGYSQTWAEDAEAEGYYCWVQEFLGSNDEYSRLDRWYPLLTELLGEDGYLVEVGDGQQRIVFGSASEAVMFRLKVVDDMV